jgi:hypothetical protein
MYLKKDSKIFSIYNNLPLLKDMNSNDRYVVIAKKLNLYRFKVITFQDIDRSEGYLYNFLVNNGPSMIYPLVMSHCLLGYNVRTIAVKDFRCLPVSPFYLYSSHTAIEYLNSKLLPYNTPLMFSEGAIDSDFLSTIYPLSFSYMTSGINSITSQFISTLTSRIIVVPDNDRAGSDGEKKTIYNMKKHGVKVDVLRVDSSFKDSGEVLDALIRGDIRAEIEVQRLKIQLNNILG